MWIFVIFRGSFGHFYALTEFSRHFMCIIPIWTTCTCSNAYKLVENQIFVLGCMLRSHARNGNEFQTPGHRWVPAKQWDAWFLNSSKSETRLKFMKLGMLSWSGTRHAVVNFLSHLGQVWVYASHKPELLTTSLMVSVGNVRPTFGDETISIASYCFQIFFSCQHRTTGVLCDFSGFVWKFLCINWVLNAFMCII